MSEKKTPLKVIAGTPDRPLVIGDVEIDCYVLENEARVLSQRGMLRGLNFARGGPRSQSQAEDDAGAQIPRFAVQKWIKPFISNELFMALRTPVLFNPRPGITAYGYQATMLPELCNAIVDAKIDGSTTDRQELVVDRARLLLRGLSNVGIIALVDEATGYQRIREERALATILEKFIAKELQPWTKTFPYEFYELLYKLRGWSGPTGHKRTHQVAHDTNDLVYDRLAHGVLEELRKKNPTVAPGRRRQRHHQWFTPDIGHPKLKEHLAGVMALMRAAPNWTSFKRALQRSLPKLNETIPMALDDDD